MDAPRRTDDEVGPPRATGESYALPRVPRRRRLAVPTVAAGLGVALGTAALAVLQGG